MWYIVTIKLPRNAKHDPRNKQTGRCVFSTGCTDVTGEHHSALMDDEMLNNARNSGLHITRVEALAAIKGIEFVWLPAEEELPEEELPEQHPDRTSSRYPDAGRTLGGLLG